MFSLFSAHPLKQERQASNLHSICNRCWTRQIK